MKLHNIIFNLHDERNRISNIHGLDISNYNIADDIAEEDIVGKIYKSLNKCINIKKYKRDVVAFIYFIQPEKTADIEVYLKIDNLYSEFLGIYRLNKEVFCNTLFEIIKEDLSKYLLT